MLNQLKSLERSPSRSILSDILWNYCFAPRDPPSVSCFLTRWITFFPPNRLYWLIFLTRHTFSHMVYRLSHKKYQRQMFFQCSLMQWSIISAILKYLTFPSLSLIFRTFASSGLIVIRINFIQSLDSSYDSRASFQAYSTWKKHQYLVFMHFQDQEKSCHVRVAHQATKFHSKEFFNNNEIHDRFVQKSIFNSLHSFGNGLCLADDNHICACLSFSALVKNLNYYRWKKRK